MISMYLDPPLAFLSSHSCNLKALLKSFIDAADAVDKSASSCPLGSNVYLEVTEPSVKSPETPCACKFCEDDGGRLLTKSLTIIGCTGVSIRFTGADVPNGIVASGPFCVQGSADVK